MKNLFKNKSFYFGLAAIFAVAVGVYIAVPTSNDTLTTEPATTTTEKVDTQVQPAVNADPMLNTDKNTVQAPAIKAQPQTETIKNAEPVNNNSAGTAN